MRWNSTIFSTRNQDNRAIEFDGPDIFAASIQPDHEEPGRSQVLEHGFEVVGARDGQMGQGACRGFFDDRGESTSTLARQNHGQGPHPHRGPGDGTQISRIFDGGADQYDGFFTVLDLFKQRLAEIFPLDEFADIANRHHTLVATTSGANPQFLGHQLLARDSGLLGQFLQRIQTGIARATLQKQALDALGLRGQQGFDGMVPANHLGGILGLRARRQERSSWTGSCPAVLEITRLLWRPIALVGLWIARSPVSLEPSRILARSWWGRLGLRFPEFLGALIPEPPPRSPVQERTCTAARERTASTN